MEGLDSQEFIPYGKQNITPEDILAVTNVLKSSMLTQGEMVPKLEEELARTFRVSHVIAVNSATSALHLACLALGLGKGDWLWTSPVSFVASSNCGLYCGARIDFVDIEGRSGLLCTNKLAEKLERAEKKGTLPKVVVPVHLTGSSCDMQKIRELSKRYGFYVMEDASHACGARYKESMVGSCEYSDVTVFSFHPVKIITTGEGGCVATNDPVLAQRLEDLRSHGITKDPSRFELKQEGPWSYEQQTLGFNHRLTDIQAALGISQLKRLGQIVEERNRLLKAYMSHLEESEITLLEIPTDCNSSVHLAVTLLPQKNRGLQRKMFEGMTRAGIGTQLHYTPIHLQPYYRKLGFKPGQFPIAEEYSERAMSIPLFPGLSDEQQMRVVRTLQLVYAGASK